MAKLLKILLYISILAFPLGEIARLQFGSVAVTLNDILIASTFLVWIGNNRKLELKGNLKKPLLVFISIAFLSLLINLYWLKPIYFGISLLYLIRFIFYSSFYFILISQSKQNIQDLKKVFIVSISLLLLSSFVQFLFYNSLRNLWYLGWDEHLYRLFAGFLDPNFAGTILVMTFMFLIYNAWQSYKKNNKTFIIFSVLTALNFIAIYLTYSRSALIMLAVSTLTFLFFIGRKKFILVAVLIFVLAIIFAPKSFQTEGTNLFRIESSRQRIESAQVAINVINKNPVIGVGFNAYRYALNKYGVAVDDIWQTTHSGAGTDNSFLFVWATTGVIGLVAFMYLLIRIFNLGFKAKDKKFGFILVSVLVGLIGNTLFINSLFYPFVLELFWIYAAFTENS